MLDKQEKVLVEQKVAQEADVVVTNKATGLILTFAGLLALTFASLLQAAVLPEDRADALYHRFDGGGVVIDGPSILVRKSIKDTVSISANYYVDNVTSASIDVVTTASAYTEQRIEKSMSVEYLRDKTILSINYGQSDENDYQARTAGFNLSQDFFGDLTTISAGYSQGWDVVGKRGEEDFARDAGRKQFRFGITQVLTKNSLIGFSWETVTDEGFLNNPYRSVRYLDPTTAIGYSFQPEVYPETRTSDAFALRGMYYLPYRAAIKAEARVFSDTWGIAAQNYQLSYTHPIGDHWIFDFTLRRYEQSKASFFSDIFSRIDAQNFLARDKEMSSFNDTGIGVAASYEHELNGWAGIDRVSLNLAVNYIQFDFEDYRDIQVQTPLPGEEPFYSFNATVTRFFFSVWY